MCSLFCVLILSSRMSSLSVSVTGSIEQLCWAHVQTLLSAVLFTTSVHAIQALPLTALHLHNNNHRDACWNLTGTALRVAIAMGLHRDNIRQTHALQRETQTQWQSFIAIIGAGIGGLALAIGLLKRNMPCTVYESASQFSAIGAGIGLGPNALRAMELMDSQFAAMYEDIKVGNTSPSRRHQQFEMLAAEEGFGKGTGWKGGSVGHQEFERSSAHRKDLLEVMKSLIPEGVVRLGKRVTGIEEVATGEKIALALADGETVTVDAVVGCDGIKGTTRHFVLGERYPEEVPAKYAHTYAYRHIVSMESAKQVLSDHAADAKWYVRQGKGNVTYPVSKGKEVNMVVFIHDPNQWEGEQATREVPRQDMLDDLAGFDRRFVEILKNAAPVRWPLFHHPNTPTYYRQNICLLGDAAHASSPSQAAGAGQGLEDALILSRLLRLVSHPSEIQIAFQVYDSIRRPRAQSVVQQSHEVMHAYYLLHPNFGDDLQKLTDDANERLLKLWWHDLEKDVRDAGRTFRSLARPERDEDTRTRGQSLTEDLLSPAYLLESSCYSS